MRDARPDVGRGALLTEAQRFLVLAVLIGICTGLVVVCFHAAIELLALAASRLAQRPGLAVLLPALGAAVAALVVHWSPVSGGSGIVQTKSALYVSDGAIPFGAVPGKFAACVLSLGSGTPLGPEDPALLMGAGIASRLGRLFGLTRRSMRLIAPTGAAAGIAAAFNTPITGVLFVLEEVVSGFDTAVLGSIVLAAVSSVVTTQLFLGENPLFSVPVVPSVRSAPELTALVVLGLASGLFATVYIRGMELVRYRLGAVHLPPAVGPFCAGIVVGVVGLAIPDVLGTGYLAMDGALHSQYTWQTMGLLALLKVAVAAVAFGTGTPGGLFAPTLFVGVMLGGATGGLLTTFLLPASEAQPTFLLAGMAGVFAGVFRAPMTAVFMTFELSGTAAAILPAMITSTVGFLVARQFHRQSILDLVASHEGAAFPSARLARPHGPLRVEDAMDAASTAAGAGVTVRHVPGQGWHVVEVGLDGVGVTLRQRVEPVYPDELLDVPMRSLPGAPIIPVISRLDATQLLGVITDDSIRRAYGFNASGQLQARDDDPAA
ncbi:Cl- channel voltage-gated family protein [Luteitalea sp. TBR-22]|uniref:chloride channel protein n=1 Tax=Luteitalea sp. TBR-22 TaxID=2802971 RepID=UPI001AFC05BB|nr:chloride channel protein [Luteitalea sp. TBR-22]BCS34967.1 Cl- channel voltage-gated family protein [Luteitalea sp. TBR-22]